MNFRIIVKSQFYNNTNHLIMYQNSMLKSHTKWSIPFKGRTVAVFGLWGIQLIGWLPAALLRTVRITLRGLGSSGAKVHLFPTKTAENVVFAERVGPIFDCRNARFISRIKGLSGSWCRQSGFGRRTQPRPHDELPDLLGVGSPVLAGERNSSWSNTAAIRV